MKNLIIVGNGFDLAHKLKTSYTDFLATLEKNEHKYNFFISKSNQLIYIFKHENKNSLWSDIENLYFKLLLNVGNESFKTVNAQYLLNYKNSKELNKDFEEIKNCLEIYLTEEEKNFTPLENFKIFFSFFNAQDTVIINFNYTKAIQEYIKKLYPPENLINIHGELNNEKNPIIFGYAADDEESKKLLNENDNDYVRNIKKFNYLFTQNEENLKQHLEKPSHFNVFILGHSCGISDKLILHQILTAHNIHKIYPFYFNDIHGYFNTMVNIDRIIDDYSKEKDDEKAFSKLVPFPNCFKIPQAEDENDEKFKKSFEEFLKSIEYYQPTLVKIF